MYKRQVREACLSPTRAIVGGKKDTARDVISERRRPCAGENAKAADREGMDAARARTDTWSCPAQPIVRGDTDPDAPRIDISTADGKHLYIAEAGSVPVPAVIGGKKDRLISRSKKIPAAYRKGHHVGIRQPGIDLRPVCPIIRGMEDTPTRASEEIVATKGDGGDTTTKRTVRLNPLGVRDRGKEEKDDSDEDGFCSRSVLLPTPIPKRSVDSS